MLQEYEDCKVHVDDLLQRVKEQMGLLELVKSATGRGSKNGIPSGKGGQGNRINKLPKFPIFSGEDPVPRDECSIDTFLFQIKGAREDITDRAVRTALLSSLRGGAGEFVEYIGLNAPLDDIIEKLTERYSTQAPEDALICQFHQMAQEKGETIREFAGRIEKIFKKLQRQVPERYPDEILLKDRLFYGMHAHLKNSLRFLHSRDTVAYTDLLRAAHAAEVESNRGRALRAKAAIMRSGESMESQEPRIQQVSQRVDELAAVVKANQARGSPSKTNGKWKTEGPREDSEISQWVAPQCWHCGGWGHLSRGCSTPYKVNWKELQAQEVGPTLKK